MYGFVLEAEMICVDAGSHSPSLAVLVLRDLAE
jgi:hypothetical protein